MIILPYPPKFDQLHIELMDMIYSMTLGNGTPLHRYQNRWLNDVRVGDYVLEVTSRWNQTDQLKRVGRLKKIWKRPIVEEGETEPYAHEPTWLVETQLGDINWHNCQFIRMITSEHQLRIFRGWATKCELAAGCRECSAVDWDDKGYIKVPLDQRL